MRVLVAGGTGVVGRSLIPMLTAAGHQVTATTRSPGKAAQLKELGRELDWKLAYPSWRQGFASGLGLPATTPAARVA